MYLMTTCFQEKEIDKMHLALTEAISKLEVQLKEQNKSLEDVRLFQFCKSNATHNNRNGGQ